MLRSIRISPGEDGMAALSQHDLQQIEPFLRGLYRARRVQPLVWYVLKELPKLVGTNQTSWNTVVPALQQADVMAWPEETEHQKYQSALARHIEEHPLIAHFVQTGDPAAFKISDFFSTTQFHNTALYDELYRGLRYEDQFAMNLQSLGPQWDTVVVARDRCTFSDRDRAVLNLLRPHIAQAYRQAQTINRLMDLVESKRLHPATSYVVLDSRDRIVQYPARAQRWIERYFDHLPTAPRRLPATIERWVTQSHSVCAGTTFSQAAVPLVVCRFGRQLRVYFVTDKQPDRVELILEERTDPHSIRPDGVATLTRRELEVMLEVEKGKRNNEIAAELGIQTRTVKKHLERIFDKLDVSNRTAAVARLRKLPRV